MRTLEELALLRFFFFTLPFYVFPDLGFVKTNG
jgi:hypothetical protein